MKWRVYVRLSRGSNLPTVWTNVLAGVVLAGGPLDGRTMAALLVSISLFYIGGMYLNDAFDREVDARERPERPIPSGLVGAGQVFTLGFGMLTAGLLVLLMVAFRSAPPNWSALGSGLVLGVAIIYYDVFHKRDPLSPLVMGACRVLIYVTAALAVAGRVAAPVAGGALVLLSYLIGLTYVAKQETLSEYRNVWPLAFLAAPFVYAAPVLGASAAGALLYVVFLAWVGYAVSLLVRRGRVNIPRAVVSFIAGISLLDAVLIARAGHPLLAGWGILGFALTLGFQRWVKGT